MSRAGPKIFASSSRYLSEGAHLRIVAPASSTSDWKKFDNAVASFRGLGFKVSLGKNVKKKKEYLAGTDAQRLSDLHDAFSEPSVDAVLCLRGGYGSARFLSGINYDLVGKNPKPIIGFSDITALQLAIYATTGINSYSGPSLLSFLQAKPRKKGEYEFNEFNFRGLLKASFKQSKPTNLLDVPKDFLKEVKVITPGVPVRGELVGGNLCILCSLLGTPYFPRLKNKILFFEEVNEAPYRFDRLLTQLVNSGQLAGVKAILVGQCNGCANWQSIVKDRLGTLKIPLITGLPFGHIDNLITLPIGRSATLGFSKGVSLTI